MAAAGVGVVDGQGLLRPFLLHLEHSVLLRRLVLRHYLVVWALRILHYFSHLYVVDIVPADLREASFFESFGAEPGFRAVVLLHLWRTGVGEGDVGGLG